MLEMNPKDNSRPSFREFLAQGEIPFGQVSLPANVTREKVLEGFSDHFKGNPREWKADGHSWIRDKLSINVLWYPVQSVYLTFRNGDLSLIEFSTLNESDSGWDYSLEVQQYFQIKKDLIKYLGKENRNHESEMQNMEAVWDFPELTLYVACDAKTGGCGIGLRSKL